ncbi:MAG: DNA gyrase/topoisomerase IV subunit A [Patescibacteria group bacterium]
MSEKEIQKSPEGETIKEAQIVDEMQDSYLDYALSVIASRALPDIRDGLKPVQRRIIYAMFEQRIRSSDRYQKSAAVVGEVLKKYHPHGDSPVYDALVRMAQDFSYRYPLVDGQGNFGSLDGDSAAAMRYTECRLTPIAEELLKDIDKETVPFIPNYSDSDTEPKILPGLLPNILLNGASGIAVGMATNIPPHNLSEVVDALNYMIGEIKIQKHPEEKEEKEENEDELISTKDSFIPFDIDSDASVEDLMEYIKGPDFPTGGEIYNKEEIIRAYATGKGRVVTRAKTEIEDIGNGKYAIVATEIPYQVNKARLITQIANLAKNDTIEDITALRDESDREGLRIVVETKQGSNPNKILNQLFKRSQLQTAYNANIVGLLDKEPKVLTLKLILEEILKWRKAIIVRRTRYSLRQAREREHILLGLKIALDHLDAVIETIRESADANTAKENLIEKFELSEIQAQAILDMQLRRLARMEREKVEQELAETVEEIKGYLKLLGDPIAIMSQIRKEFGELKEKYGDERRTVVHPGKPGEFAEEDLTQKEDILITLTEDGYIKRVNPQTFRSQHRGGKGVIGMKTKEDDTVFKLISATTLDTILFFTAKGKVLQTRGFEIPEGRRTSRGKALVNVLNLSPEEEVVAVIALGKEETQNNLLFATEKGTVKKSALDEYENIRSGGITAIKIKEGDRLAQVTTTSGNDQVMLITKQGKSIRFNESETRQMGRVTSGVKGIKLAEDDQVVAMNIITEEQKKDTLLTVSRNGYGKKTALEDYSVQGRGGKGIIAMKITEKTGPLADARLLNEEQKDLFLISKEGQVIRLNPQDISTLGRATQGVKVMRLDENDAVAALAFPE